MKPKLKHRSFACLAVKDFLRGHEVSLYYDAESLLLDVEQNKTQYDLYLLDIYIEDVMNGIELAGKLRSTDGCRKAAAS